MTPAKLAALYERKQKAERDMLRAMRRYERLTAQIRRAERTLDKQFNARAALPAETTDTIPGKADVRLLGPYMEAKARGITETELSQGRRQF